MAVRLRRSKSLRPTAFHALLALASVSGCSASRSELVGSTAQAVTLPDGFVDETVGSGWDQALGLTFDSGGRLYVWEKAGKVWLVENGVKAAAPFIDISDEVGNFGDYGLLGFAVHPDFADNGYIFLLYSVDHDYLATFGTPDYHPGPGVSDQSYDTIGRLTRYTARASDGFHSVDLSTRRVLVGESIDSGFPLLDTSHGVGSIAFGTDGTLLASCGDGANYFSLDTGGPRNGSSNTGLDDGIIGTNEDVGALRAQLVDSLSGKVIRVDPLTGDAPPSNPFYDPAAPRAARSRVWALGLRNPYRITLRPDTGSHRAADGNPGSLYLGDVGNDDWEEIDVANAPGLDFGWPLYEGLEANAAYMATSVDNKYAPNPLFGTAPAGQPVCNQPYFTFNDLLVQETQNSLSFPNRCDPTQSIPSTLHRFMHTRPVIDWHHGADPSARTGIFVGGVAATAAVGAPGSPVAGPSYGGNCSTGGVFYTGADFPAEYKDTYFHADFGARWIKNFVFDSSDRPTAVRDFVPDGSAAVVALASDPLNGGLYFIDYGESIHKISYVGGGNRPPLAKALANVAYGPSPLTVSFNGAGSTDPEMGPLTYEWNFGDGTAHVMAANPTHVFTGVGALGYTVTLSVTDVAGATSSTTLLISVNNTPPEVSITSPVDGSLYELTSNTYVTLGAAITDAEQGPSQRTCAWQTILHHNNHTHPGPIDSSCATATQLSPAGCDGNTYWYELKLTVTDAPGLSTTKSVSMYPDCLCYPVGAPPVVCAGGSCLAGSCFSSGDASPPDSAGPGDAASTEDGGLDGRADDQDARYGGEVDGSSEVDAPIDSVGPIDTMDEISAHEATDADLPGLSADADGSRVEEAAGAGGQAGGDDDGSACADAGVVELDAALQAGGSLVVSRNDGEASDRGSPGPSQEDAGVVPSVEVGTDSPSGCGCRLAPARGAQGRYRLFGLGLGLGAVFARRRRRGLRR